MAIRALLVGLGFMGSRWAKLLQASPDFDLTAYVKAEPTKFQEKLNLEGTPGFRTATEALERVEVDCAIIATPAFTHHEVCLEVFEKGVPALLEKPIETDWAKARAIVVEAKKRDLLLVIDQNMRYTSPIRTLRRLAQNCELGTPGFATVIHYRNRKGAGTYARYMPHAMLLDMSIHHIDALRFVLGSDAAAVIARTWNPSWSDYSSHANVDLLIEFRNGARATYSGSNAARGAAVHVLGDWRIECEHGGIYLDGNCASPELYCVPDGMPPALRVSRDFDPLPAENQALLLMYFKDCLQSGCASESSGEDNLKSLAIAMAAIASADRRQRVEIAEFLEG
jgi:predicted dehydrogenase